MTMPRGWYQLNILGHGDNLGQKAADQLGVNLASAALGNKGNGIFQAVEQLGIDGTGMAIRCNIFHRPDHASCQLN